MRASQLAFVALEVERIEAELAKERQGARTDIVGTKPTMLQDAGKARDKAASTVGVNAKYVTDAKRIAREAPELAEKIKAGDTTKAICDALKVRNEKPRRWAGSVGLGCLWQIGRIGCLHCPQHLVEGALVLRWRLREGVQPLVELGHRRVVLLDRLERHAPALVDLEILTRLHRSMLPRV